MLQDSGNRRTFETGAVRDIDENKGRCDLLPLKEIAGIIESSSECLGKRTYKYKGKVSKILCHMANFLETLEEKQLQQIIIEFVIISSNQDDASLGLSNNFYTATLELAKHYEEGAKKYSERNWEKGIPLHCFIDSAMRHFFKWLRGDNDECHDRAFLWNVYGALWTMKNKPQMIDIKPQEREVN